MLKNTELQSELPLTYALPLANRVRVANTELMEKHGYAKYELMVDIFEANHCINFLTL